MGCDDSLAAVDSSWLSPYGLTTTHSQTDIVVLTTTIPAASPTKVPSPGDPLTGPSIPVYTPPTGHGGTPGNYGCVHNCGDVDTTVPSAAKLGDANAKKSAAIKLEIGGIVRTPGVGVPMAWIDIAGLWAWPVLPLLAVAGIMMWI